LEECGPCPVFASYTRALALQPIKNIFERESCTLKENGIGGKSTYVFESANQEMPVNKQVCYMSGVPNMS